MYGHEVGEQSSPQQDISPPHLVPLPIASPEEIRLCDPAVGSGHMLTYAFDLLYAIYEEEGYPPSDIPRLILTNNLYGMEIDERAAALAAFALTMKARAKDRRFLSRSTRDNIRPNICVLHPIALTEQELKPEMERLAAAVAERYGHEVGRETPSSQQDAISPPHLVPLLLHDLTLFADADNFGSLLRPQLSPAQIRAARAALDDDAAGQIDWTRQTVRDQMRQALDQAETLARQATMWWWRTRRIWEVKGKTPNWGGFFRSSMPTSSPISSLPLRFVSRNDLQR